MSGPLSPKIMGAAQEMGEHFAGWRKILGLTTDQVAQRADITRTTLRKLEQGDPTVGLHVALRVARALGVLDSLAASIDPLNTDLGRARAGLLNRKRVR